MPLGSLLLVFDDAIAYLKGKGLLKDDGTFASFTPQEDAELAAAIEKSLVDHGVNVPVKVDKIIKALPAIVEIIETL